MLYIKRLLLALAAASFLAGCGGGSGPSTATVDAANAKDLAVAGTEATKFATESGDVPLFKSSGTSSTFDVHEFSKQIAQNMYAVTDYSSFVCTGGGSYLLNISDASTQSSFSGTATFTDCTFSEGLSTIVINGTVSVSGTSSSMTITANLTVTTDGVAESASFRGTCSYSGSTVGACTYSASFTGIDGRTYSMNNISVSGDYFSGYSVSGTVTDPNHGVITISTTTPVTFNCPDGRPDSGTIVLTGNGTATVSYDSCASFTITLDGVGTSYNWVDI